ncbi:unnamed protein product, partial [Timema podura]|nr:unnamed protein product [Timema podura]
VSASKNTCGCNLNTGGVNACGCEQLVFNSLLPLKLGSLTTNLRVILQGTDGYMPPCDHEEADTRLLIHLQDAPRNGCTNCMVHTVDMNVVVILLERSTVIFYQANDVEHVKEAGKELFCQKSNTMQ